MKSKKRSISIPPLLVLLLVLPACAPSSLTSWAQTAPTVPQIGVSARPTRSRPSDHASTAARAETDQVDPAAAAAARN